MNAGRSRLGSGLWFLGAPCAALVVACGGAHGAAPGNPATVIPEIVVRGATASLDAGTPPPAKAATDRDADAIVARALVEASRIRELPVTGVVHGRTLTRTEMATQVEKSIEHELPPEVVASEGDMLVALGVAPPSFDYAKAIVSLMTAELAGYYEPAEKTMYLASDLGPAERQATLSHELVHALQDQHYDLGRLLDYRPDESDVQSALHALAEGDATSAMLDAMLAPRGQKATDLSEQLLGIEVRASAELSVQVQGVPDILKRSLIAPYIEGVELVQQLRRRGGWAAVDEAWKHPPTSTEQLLHPEKLLAHENPEIIDVPPPPRDGPATLVYHDVLGEESSRLMLEEWLPRHAAEEAASHWAGDRLGVFRDGDRVAVLWHLRYDDVAAATRGEHAFERGAGAQADDASASSGAKPDAKAGAGPKADLQADSSPPRERRCVERSMTGPFSVTRKGRDIAIVGGPFLRQGAGATASGTCAGAAAWAARALAGH
jgi:hypothetical protein